MTPWVQTVENLKALVAAREDLQAALAVSIANAHMADIRNLDQYYIFLTGMLTEIPTQRLMGPSSDKFHYLVSQSPDNLLKTDPSFRRWLTDFSQGYGSFLDTTESAGHLNTFINDSSYQISDYDPGPNWMVNL